MRILILNGPNLNLLGIREREIYGTTSFETYMDYLRKSYPDLLLEVCQSNCEGELIRKIHDVGFSYDGIILNAGAYTHTSIAIADAVAAVTTPVIEVHISNPASREAFRHHSFLSPVSRGVISGFGLSSYELALRAFLLQKGNE